MKPYLSSFGLDKFRTFSKPTDFDLAPLTILTGPNSSGKSSLFKALLLLEESAAQHRLETLSFPSTLHRLGSYASALSHGAEEPMRFTVGIAGAMGNDLPLGPLSSNARSYAGGREGVTTIPWKWPEKAEITLGYRGGTLGYLEIALDDGGARTPFFTAEAFNGRREGPYGVEMGTWVLLASVNGEWLYKNFGGSSPAVAELLGLASDDPYTAAFFESLNGQIEWQDATSTHPDTDDPVPIEAFIQQDVWDPRAWPMSLGRGPEHVDPVVEEMMRSFMFFTVGPLIHRCLKATLDTLANVEFHGRSGVPLRRVLQAGEADPAFYRLLKVAARDRHTRQSSSKWLQLLGVGDDLEVDEIVGGAFTVSVRRGEGRVSLSDVGHGHAQLVPLILHLAYEVGRTTLLLEEPEANLHPNLQSRLADLFVELIGEVDTYSTEHLEYLRSRTEEAESDRPRSRPNLLSKRLIVETHSEYLVRRLQYLVATGRVDPSRVIIYYLGPDPTASDYVRQIRITESGQLSQEFGPGFFDEATNLMVDLYKHGSQN